jgi:capsular polysaccharide biosynthesis protein
MGTLSCEEQVDTFRKHNVVIGVHGNNLSGIMWMKPESFVFEILPIEFKQDVYDYHCMSLCMKHNYTQVDCANNGLNSVYTLTENSLRAIDYNLKLIYNIFK